MQFSHILFGATLLGLNNAAGFAAAGDMPQSMSFSVTNTGAETLECAASIAHWFSEDLGAIEPGATLSFSFGYALETGTIFRLNEPGDEMAVQRLWCGVKGRAWESRSELPLPRSAGETPAAVRLDCAAETGKTLCTAS